MAFVLKEIDHIELQVDFGKSLRGYQLNVIYRYYDFA